MYEQTEGNPLFAAETVRLLALEGLGRIRAVVCGSGSPERPRRDRTTAHPPLGRTATTYCSSRRFWAGSSRSTRSPGWAASRWTICWTSWTRRSRPASCRMFRAAQVVFASRTSSSATRSTTGSPTHSASGCTGARRRRSRSCTAIQSRETPEHVLALAQQWSNARVPARAIAYYRRGAELALRVFANHEAAEALTRGVDLLHQMPKSSSSRRGGAGAHRHARCGAWLGHARLLDGSKISRSSSDGR